MARTILNRTIQAAQRVMESRRDQSGLSQSQEIHDLKEQLYLFEKRCRELEREVNDYREREESLLSEIEELNEKLRSKSSRGPLVTPYIIMEQPMKKTGKGLAEDWDYFMYAFTDDIFIKSDKPDLLLYWNGVSYVNPNGTVSLTLPVTQKALDERGILKVRPLTEEELDDVAHKYNLITQTELFQMI